MKELGRGHRAPQDNELRNKLDAMLSEGKTIPFPEIAVTPPRQAPNRGGNNESAEQPAAGSDRSRAGWRSRST